MWRATSPCVIHFREKKETICLLFSLYGLSSHIAMYCSDSECLTFTSCGAEIEVSVFFDSEELPKPQKMRLSMEALFGGLVWNHLRSYGQICSTHPGLSTGIVCRWVPSSGLNTSSRPFSMSRRLGGHAAVRSAEPTANTFVGILQLGVVGVAMLPGHRVFVRLSFGTIDIIFRGG